MRKLTGYNGLTVSVTSASYPCDAADEAQVADAPRGRFHPPVTGWQAPAAGATWTDTVLASARLRSRSRGAHSWELRPDFQRRIEVPPERVARTILRAVQAGRFEVVAPGYMRAVLLLQRIAPGVFRREVGRYYATLVEPRIAASPGPPPLG